MSRLMARMAGSALLFAPVIALAGEATPGAPTAVGPAVRGTAGVPPADEEFLEYLGSWDGSDEDWVIAGVAVKVDASGNGQPAGTGKERDK